MKGTELKELVRVHYDDIIEAIREANREAYKNPTCEYSVALYSDGHIEQRERLAGDNWWCRNDPAVLVIGSFCWQYYDVLRDNLFITDLHFLLESEMDSNEAQKYNTWREEYEEKECDFPDDFDAVDWIEEHLFDLWERVRDKAIEELVTDQESETAYEEKLNYSVEMFIQYQEE